MKEGAALSTLASQQQRSGGNYQQYGWCGLTSYLQVAGRVANCQVSDDAKGSEQCEPRVLLRACCCYYSVTGRKQRPKAPTSKSEPFDFEGH